MKGALSKTKHFQISQLLGQKLREMSPGDVLPTVAELMRDYSASQVTITQALDRLRRQGMVERQLGGKRLRVAASDRPLCRVVLIRPSWPSPDFDFLLYAIQEEAIRRHWGIDIHCYAEIENLNLAHAMDGNDAAIFVPSAHALPAQLCKTMRTSEKPVVCLRQSPPYPEARSILLDDRAIGRLAARHLAEVGHRRITAMLSEPHSHHSEARLEGFRAELRRRSLTEAAVADCSVPPGSDAMQGSYERFSEWLAQPARPRFSALFCLDWTGALAASRALREAGIQTPSQASIVAFGGEEKWMAFLNPPLTTVEINAGESARRALRMVEDAFHGAPGGASEMLRPFLVARASTAKWPANGKLV
jgi:DNA-binding LacI/PurR family transcriptional regulator